MSFINEDFLLTTDHAQQLYHEYAANEPILDYHNHHKERHLLYLNYPILLHFPMMHTPIYKY